MFIDPFSSGSTSTIIRFLSGVMGSWRNIVCTTWDSTWNCPSTALPHNDFISILSAFASLLADVSPIPSRFFACLMVHRMISCLLVNSSHDPASGAGFPSYPRTFPPTILYPAGVLAGSVSTPVGTRIARRLVWGTLAVRIAIRHLAPGYFFCRPLEGWKCCCWLLWGESCGVLDSYCLFPSIFSGNFLGFIYYTAWK